MGGGGIGEKTGGGRRKRRITHSKGSLRRNCQIRNRSLLNNLKIETDDMRH